jgi:hypothetical protein
MDASVGAFIVARRSCFDQPIGAPAPVQREDALTDRQALTI